MAEHINVEVYRGILHIGSAAYPLRNIARVQSVRVKFRRWLLFQRFLSIAVPSLVLGVAATVAIKYAQSHNAGFVNPDNQQHYVAIVWTAVAAIVAPSTAWLLIRFLQTLRQYYALVIETAGVPSALLFNPGRSVIDRVAASLTKALEDPDSPLGNFRQTVNNYHFGHNITQFGAGSRVGI